ncbi:hypothetical protein NEUTE1DRAFT_50089 [Neurospora tetrasperma FGSC 2508]|uniref:BTB domain-containing protein n=1 Tax=Neurospora tetrasperma (strain FGSC 2508 / ATCC MYA-4615 / P0657) TaxID=510951 RepID=F8MVF1_NEUT8|nr:uncharacterized protein NEUTE1DRAFT_50089 [Neurospora tetrasperma FGSC 2508]EGO54754.1 hypothetical protein NEUTE1DRAFT_50089 [Neurospora tetrasperma FGSC 2508]EGZ67767.1 hypothetical protein NEUTE2DRAFT_132440 [Neurospora tetrasperma FGSC 2509]
MDSEPAIIETAPVTDLVLVVGPGTERIPVESAILKAASPVFASMFSPPWLESKSKEIPLPEDDSDAMRFITLTLSYHNEHELVTKPRTPQEILQIAIAADKYDLRTALKFVLDFLFREASKTCPVAKNEDGSQTAMAGEDIVYLCASAYALDRCDYFSRFALDMMCYHRLSFFELMNDELISSILPSKFFERFIITYNKPGNGSILHRGMKTLQELLAEDKSFIRGHCLERSRAHSNDMQTNLSLSTTVQTAYEEFDAILCVYKLKNKDGCDAKHARLTAAGPTN